MKNIYFIFTLISFSINAQSLISDSIVVENNFLNEINKIKIYNDSIASNFEDFKSSSNKKLINVKRFSYNLNDLINSNYSENQSIKDSLFNKDEELISKINESIKQLEEQKINQQKNTDLYLTLNNIVNKSDVITTIFFILIFACLFFFVFYCKNYAEKIKSEYDSKLDNLLSTLKSLNETVLSISASSDKLRTRNELLQKNIKSFSQDLVEIKADLKKKE